MIKVDCPEPTTSIQRLLEKRSRDRGRWESRFQPARVVADLQTQRIIRDTFFEKCGYCECLEANSIDHFWPRNPNRADQERFPDVYRIWDWSNFIWCCEKCQDTKRNQIPVSDTGYWMINPKEDEPLYFLDINQTTGEITAVPIQANGIEQRGIYTLQVLELSSRTRLNKARRKMYRDIRNHMLRIVDERSSQDEREAAWSELQEDLDPYMPYLAVVYQLFTLPTEDEELLLQRLYEVIPGSYEALARFRRELPPYPEEH